VSHIHFIEKIKVLLGNTLKVPSLTQSAQKQTANLGDLQWISLLKGKIKQNEMKHKPFPHIVCDLRHLNPHICFCSMRQRIDFQSISELLLENICLWNISEQLFDYICIYIFFNYLFIHMCIHHLGHFSPLPPLLPSPPPASLTSSQNLFCLYL
jgi:hypothetical protein